jgi:hypothetical protein
MFWVYFGQTLQGIDKYWRKLWNIDWKHEFYVKLLKICFETSFRGTDKVFPVICLVIVIKIPHKTPLVPPPTPQKLAQLHSHSCFTHIFLITKAALISKFALIRLRFHITWWRHPPTTRSFKGLVHNFAIKVQWIFAFLVIDCDRLQWVTTAAKNRTWNWILDCLRNRFTCGNKRKTDFLGPIFDIIAFSPEISLLLVQRNGFYGFALSTGTRENARKFLNKNLGKQQREKCIRECRWDFDVNRRTMQTMKPSAESSGRWPT